MQSASVCKSNHTPFAGLNAPSRCSVKPVKSNVMVSERAAAARDGRTCLGSSLSKQSDAAKQIVRVKTASGNLRAIPEGIRL